MKHSKPSALDILITNYKQFRIQQVDKTKNNYHTNPINPLSPSKYRLLDSCHEKVNGWSKKMNLTLDKDRFIVFSLQPFEMQSHTLN